MLEQKIEELIAVVKELTAAISMPKSGISVITHTPFGGGGGKVPVQGMIPVTVGTFSDNVGAVGAAGGNTKKAEEAPNEKPKETDTEPTSSPSEKESATVTYDQVKQATIAVSKVSRDKAIAGLARFGVKGAKDLNESQWSEYITYMTDVAAGKIDPQASHE